MLQDLVLQNRSYRGFDESVPIGEEQLRELVALARLTPSSVNLQPLKYYLSADAKINAKIFPYTKWAGRLQKKVPYEGHHPTGYIVICVDKTIAPNTLPFMKDVGIAAQTILLGATEKNFGGCMIGAFDVEGLCKALGLQESLEPALVIALGKPDHPVVLTQPQNGEVGYYRDEQDVHYVPKRPLEELILPSKE